MSKSVEGVLANVLLSYAGTNQEKTGDLDYESIFLADCYC